LTWQLKAAIYFSTLIQQVHPNATYRDGATAMMTKVSSAQTALSLNRQVYLALTALDVSKSDPARASRAAVAFPRNGYQKLALGRESGALKEGLSESCGPVGFKWDSGGRI
jgi:Zn-dependent oligopeptidase